VISGGAKKGTIMLVDFYLLIFAHPYSCSPGVHPPRLEPVHHVLHHRHGARRLRAHLRAPRAPRQLPRPLVPYSLADLNLVALIRCALQCCVKHCKYGRVSL
jgi:hypothetical protein